MKKTFVILFVILFIFILISCAAEKNKNEFLAEGIKFYYDVEFLTENEESNDANHYNARIIVNQGYNSMLEDNNDNIIKGVGIKDTEFTENLTILIDGEICTQRDKFTWRYYEKYGRIVLCCDINIPDELSKVNITYK